MKTPEEIKEGLGLCKRAKGDSCDKCPYQIEPLEINANCIRALENDALAYIKQLEAAQPKWISAKERLPDRMKPVLVCREGADGNPIVEQGYKDVGDWWKVYGTRTKHIIAWMPMPLPPGEECLHAE